MLLSPPAVGDNLALISIKTLWVGVGFTLVGAALTMVMRSTFVALVTLLVAAWIVEPMVLQVLDLTPSLHPLEKGSAFLPFTLMKDVLGDPARLDLGSGSHPDPRNAAVGTLVLASMSVAVAIYRYCTADST